MQGVIIAAGQSSRFWPMNQQHKALVHIMGKPLIWYTIRSLFSVGIKEIIVVQAANRMVEKELSRWPIKGLTLRFEIQEEPRGTGDAILHAKKWIKERFIVLNAEHLDVSLYAKKIFKEKDGIVLVCSETKNPELYGILSVEGDRVVGIVEKPAKNESPSNLKLWGMHILTPDFLDCLAKEQSHPYSLIFALSKYAGTHAVKYEKLQGSGFTLKFPWDIFGVRDFIFKNYLKKRIEKGSKIHKSVILKGDIYISEGAQIQEYSIIEGPCFIGKNCIIGKQNVLRGPLNLEDDIYTGAGMEIKNSVIGSGTHFHSGYVGDSFIGSDCRFGAGFVSANRRIDRGNIIVKVKGEKIDTGSSYFGFACGPRTKFGIHAETMPGVLIGRDCIIGPHTTVKDNIEDGKKVYTVSRQEIQEDNIWPAEKK